MHTHSIASGHGTSDTIAKMAKAAKARGMRLLGITDHGPATMGSAKEAYFQSLTLAPRWRCGIEILYGTELNILDLNGSLDLPREILSRLDYAVASMHSQNLMHGDICENTTGYLNVMKNPKVKILGHIDRDGFPCNYEEVVKACAKSNTIVELNNSSIDIKDNRRIIDRDLEILSYCIKYSCPIIINSDAHIKYDVGNYLDALKVIDEAKFPYDLVLNFNESLFNQYF